MAENRQKYDVQRGCYVMRNNVGQPQCRYDMGCCKRSVFDWLKGLPDETLKNIYEVRFKNTRKGFYLNDSGEVIKEGDIVVTEAQTGYDVGIVTLNGAVMAHQLKRNRIEPESYEFKHIYRKARPNDIIKWQEAISREHSTMMKARELAVALGLDMKIGDVEFQGDGSKAIFYYIADERVDFRQLIKDYAEAFRIRIEMKQIGARQEAGLIGGIGVCGQALCCSRYMNDFQSITTTSARCQDLSLNPQKLAGQCGKLKCCINYEAPIYIDAKNNMPNITRPLILEDGEVSLVKIDVLKGMMWFSYDQRNATEAYPVNVEKVKEILALNAECKKGKSLADVPKEKIIDFKSAAGEDSITRFDNIKSKRGRGGRSGGSKGGGRNSRPQNGSRRNDSGRPKHRPGGENQ